METLSEALRSELEKLGLSAVKDIRYNLDRAGLITQAVLDGEGVLTDAGALVVNTSPFTGRSPNDKYLIDNGDPDLWYASGTESLSDAQFKSLQTKLVQKMSNQRLYVRDVFAGADPEHTARVRVITDLAWQNLAASNMFIESRSDQPHIDPDFTILVSSQFTADPLADGLRSPAMVILSFDAKQVLIGNTRYAGEIKKSVFTFMNYLLPKKGILPLHCSANKGHDGSVALFFGLSGTGKTTLSSDPERALIGDDEHGWSESGMFNFEGGCYAKTIRINPKYEPLVWSAINRFGCLIENVPLDEKHHPDFDSSEITENTRASYPLEFISNYEPSGMGGHPNHIFFLTADAFGVMPPLAKLSNAQAMYYFLSGYTSKLAGTERGLGDKPQATFSTCFGAPFLPLKPTVYAELLSRKLTEHGTQVWLLNTGWSGGAFGTGQRIALPLTRAMISAVLSGTLDQAATHTHPIFGVEIPDEVPGVPQEVLNPELSWSDQVAYAEEAASLAKQFARNFEKYRDSVSLAVAEAGPRIN
ncbi:MAG TPA: phosphoenolpyruvate carboxykinase (ATP) [Anaerolineaceae bacterium]|nr:phosphoenolpyruvate carboxykinase (ATP) [Anaerolineaceae bacterium]